MKIKKLPAKFKKHKSFAFGIARSSFAGDAFPNFFLNCIHLIVMTAAIMFAIVWGLNSTNLIEISAATLLFVVCSKNVITIVFNPNTPFIINQYDKHRKKD